MGLLLSHGGDGPWVRFSLKQESWRSWHGTLSSDELREQMISRYSTSCVRCSCTLDHRRLERDEDTDGVLSVILLQIIQCIRLSLDEALKKNSQ